MMFAFKLLLILLSFSFDGPRRYEDPRDCACRLFRGKRVCNSACEVRR